MNKTIKIGTKLCSSLIRDHFISQPIIFFQQVKKVNILELPEKAHREHASTNWHKHQG